MIDAEAEYEGHYAAAQTYINDLRAKVGPAYPLALASFPYVSYHPSLPYSVFLGPNGAQYNAPQMYWKDIGVSVDTVYANTYIGNRIYGRPIFPLGQTYGGVSAADVLRFREEAVDYGATGFSFWDWQETPAERLEHAGRAAGAADERHPQHHLPGTGQRRQRRSGPVAAGAPGQRDPDAGNDRRVRRADDEPTCAPSRPPTRSPVSGVADAATWAALLALPPSRSTGRGRAGGLTGALQAPPERTRAGPQAGQKSDALRRAGSASRCRDRRRSTSSRSRSPCRSARARAAAW